MHRHPTKLVTLISAVAAPFILMLTPFGATAQEPDALAPTEQSTEEIVANVRPAVVLIESQAPGGWEGQGSGFIVDPSGTIVTNHHVIEGARRLRVRLPNGDQFETIDVMDVDEKRDLGVLRVRGFSMPTVPLGNSDSVLIGARAVAIGSPLGLENTVSTGVISGRREIDGYQLLQVSTPISPGSSGGPVFGPDGKAVGVAVAGITKGEAQNLNFAVPINYARGMLAYLPEEPRYSFTAEGREGAAPSSPTRTLGSEDRVNQFFTPDYTGVEVDAMRLKVEEDLERNRKRIAEITYDLRGNPSDPGATVSAYADLTIEWSECGLCADHQVGRYQIKITAGASDFRPISATLQGEYYDGSRWRSERSDLEVSEDLRVTGTIQSGSGDRSQVDRVLPPGTIPSEMTAMAFALMAADSVMGEEFVFETYSFFQDELEETVYTVEEGQSIAEVDGDNYEALRVLVESGLDRRNNYYMLQRPRLTLGGYGEDQDVFEVKEIEF